MRNTSVYDAAVNVVSNPRNEKMVETRLVKNLRRVLKSRPDLEPLVPYALDGVRLFNYLFDATRAAEKVVVPVKGFTLQPVTVETSTKRGEKVIAVSNVILNIISEAMKSKEEQVAAAMGRLKAERLIVVPRSSKKSLRSKQQTAKS